MATPEQEAALFARVAALETQVAAGQTKINQLEAQMQLVFAQKDKYLRWDQVEVAGDMDYLRYFPTKKPNAPVITTIAEAEAYFDIEFTPEERTAIIEFVQHGTLPSPSVAYFLYSILRRIKLVNGLEDLLNDDR